MKTLILSLITVFVFCNSQRLSAQDKQQPILIYAIDTDANGILDTVSEDWQMCQNAENHDLPCKKVVIPVTNWPIKEHTFEHSKKVYIITLPELTIKTK